MSILVDSNQYLISLILYNYGDDIDVEAVKRLFLKQINTYYTRFSNFGNIILCFDNQQYWRKKEFPNYKYNRKNDRKKSAVDWNDLFNNINIIKSSLHTSPYTVLDVAGSEADDIIAVLSKYEHKQNLPTLVISGDKDFDQLLLMDTVTIYNPQQNLIKCRSLQ